MNLEEVLNLLNRKAECLIKNCPEELPEAPGCLDGRYFTKENLSAKKEFKHIMNWTTSFYTGMALLAYENSGNRDFLQFAASKNERYYQKVFCTPEDTMHDLGFLYSPHSVAMYRLTGDLYSKQIAVRAAEVLSGRFLPKYGVIRAWGRMDGTIPPYVSEEESKDHFFRERDNLAIIDCMMNLPLLYFAWEETGNPFFAEIADSHANVTLSHFMRADGSIYHSYRFGANEGGCNYCGFSDESFWARGAAWAIYGFALAYRYRKNEAYLRAAECLAERFISCLPKECPVPVWDFFLPDTEEKTLDTSAAAVAANGFLLLGKYSKQLDFYNYAEKIAQALWTHFTNKDVNVEGILKEQNGKHQYTNYGDYFFFELIMNLYKADRQLYW